MNRSILRLFSVVVLLFTVLVAWTSRWTVFSATALDNNRLNPLQYYATLKVKRGEILADDGTTVLARSVRATGGTWRRVYPQGSLFSQVVGYYFPQNGATGLEAARDAELEGTQNQLTNLFGSFNGTPTVGNDVYTTLDPTAQALARQLVQETMASFHAVSGSVVAIDPETGAVKVAYSSPSYNDNLAGGHDYAKRCAQERDCSEVFDAFQGRYPPGSTFKLVTSTAALDSGKFTPESTLAGPSPLMVSGAPLENDGDQSWPAGTTLTEALTYSINTIYAQVGQTVGAPLMQRYMQRFGFYSVPPLDFPADEMSASGALFYRGECGNHSSAPKLVPVTSSCVDLGRTSIGQANLAVTPLQMAMVVSAIADDGKLMQPRLVTKVVNNLGQTVETVSPQEDDQVMAPKAAKELQAMMRDVVEEGTGTAANLEGLSIAGKTGTASTGLCEYGEQPVDGNCPNAEPLDDAWFVGFPENDPKIAVAVELTDIPNGYGGQFAAPIAAKVIQNLLAQHQ